MLTENSSVYQLKLLHYTNIVYIVEINNSSFKVLKSNTPTVPQGQIHTYEYITSQYGEFNKIFICKLSEYEDLFNEKIIIYKEKEVEKVIEKETPVYQYIRIKSFNETLIDKWYNKYCKNKGRETEEYV